MHAGNAEVGKKYLSKKGTPVVIVRFKDDKVVLKIAGSDNEIDVAKNYELKPYKAAQVSKDARALAHTNSRGNGKKPGRKSKDGSVASFIDPLLFSGGKTVKEIADLVTKQAAELSKGKDMQANVRARLFGFRRKGFLIEKDGKKRIKVIQKKG